MTFSRLKELDILTAFDRIMFYYYSREYYRTIHIIIIVYIIMFLLQAIDRDVQELEKLKDPTGIMINILTNKSRCLSIIY